MSHHRDDRRTRFEILRTVHLLGLVYLFGDVGSDKLDLIAELLGHKHKRLGIEPLVDGHHQAKAHAGSDDLHHRGVVHEGRKVIDGHELRNFQYLLFRCRLRYLFLGTLRRSLSLLLAVLGPEVVFLALVHLGISLLDLLLNLFLEFLLLAFGQCRFEAVTVALAALALGLLPLLRLLTARATVLVVVLVLLRRLLDILSRLGDIHLACALADALAFFCRLTVKLAEVDLPHHLETRSIG